MNRNKSRSLIIYGIVLALYLVLALAIPFPKNTPVFWISFVFSLIAICAQIYVMKIAFEKGAPVKSKFYGFPIARIGVIYLGVQLVLGFLMMALGFAFRVPVWVAIIVFALVLGVSAVGFISADIMRDEVERQDDQLKKDVRSMRALQSKTAYIVTQCGDDETKDALKDLADKFRFSDPVSSDALASIEADLAAIVDELQNAVMEGDNDSAKSLCAKAAAALEERNTMCKLNK